MFISENGNLEQVAQSMLGRILRACTLTKLLTGRTSDQLIEVEAKTRLLLSKSWPKSLGALKRSLRTLVKNLHKAGLELFEKASNYASSNVFLESINELKRLLLSSAFTPAWKVSFGNLWSRMTDQWYIIRYHFSTIANLS